LSSAALRVRGEVEPISVATAIRCSAPPDRVWNALVFYEQIDRRPPWPLRVLLPVPVRAEGARSAEGDETRCVYEHGYLVKRMIRVQPLRRCEFEVIEQELGMPGEIRLAGGGYTLNALPGGSTRLELETHYFAFRRPRRLWRPIETALCHAFHRHILDAIQRGAGPAGAAARPSQLRLPARVAPSPDR
jgi:hypothetical protein